MYGGIITRVEAEEIKLQKIMVNDGAVYYGQLVDGQRHGYGTYTNANGNKYVGDYVESGRKGWQI